MGNKAYREAHKKHKKEYDQKYYQRIKNNKRKEWLKLSSQERKNYQTKKLYGITPEERQTLSDLQGGVCAICGRDNNGKELDIDHAHDETKRIRGLLCRKCNHGLGNFRDSPELLSRAIEYLNK